MKKSKKIILTISAVTLTAGVLLTGIGYMKGGRFGFVFSDGKFISADSIEEEKQPFILEKKKLDSVKDIDINILSYADIRILPSADNSFYLEYNLPGEYPEPAFSCTDGKLTLTQENREPIAIIGFGFHDSQSSEREVTLYVPSKAELNSCKLYSDSGNIQASDLTASDFGIGCDYGDVTLKNIKSKGSLALNLSAGQLNADTLSGKTVTIYNDSGNISLDSCTSYDLHLETDYGDIQLDNAAVKNASDMTLDSGILTIKNSALGTARITNDSGTIFLAQVTGKSLEATSEYGDISLTDTQLSDNAVLTLDSGNLSADTSSVKKISVKNDSGSISLNQFSSENADFMLSYGDLDLIATKLGSLSCKSENGDVAIQLPDKFDSYGFNLLTEYGDISLPSGKADGIVSDADYGDIQLDNAAVKNASDMTLDSGILTIKNSALGTARITNDSGTIFLAQVTGKSLEATSEYGDISLTDTQLSDNAVLTLDSGNLSADTSSVKKISVKNDSGSISLNQFSSENADFMLSYGDLDLIATKLGSLSCKSENGDVAIQLPDKFDSYGFNLLTEYGDISLPSGKTDGIVSDEDDSSEVSYSANPEAKNKIQVECESGNIQIR